MRVLPPQILPWRTAIKRRHSPPPAQGRYGYRAYRQCLRWEFGFTCPFCLCHESDFVPRGAEGLGVTQIEHFVPASHDEEGTNDYINCYYICLFCNQDRRAIPTIEPKEGSRLLNPCDDVWAERFVVDGDALKPRRGGRDAAYTSAVYDLNDPRKIEMRRFRRETIRDCMSLIERGEAVLNRLLDRALEANDPALVEEAKLIEDALRRAWQELEAFKVVPRDVRRTCPCDGENLYTVPQALQEQTIDIESPLGSWPSK